jgi:hypothetical protein
VFSLAWCDYSLSALQENLSHLRLSSTAVDAMAGVSRTGDMREFNALVCRQVQQSHRLVQWYMR